jgi:hypothetical protein
LAKIPEIIPVFHHHSSAIYDLKNQTMQQGFIFEMNIKFLSTTGKLKISLIVIDDFEKHSLPIGDFLGVD